MLTQAIEGTAGFCVLLFFLYQQAPIRMDWTVSLGNILGAVVTLFVLGVPALLYLSRVGPRVAALELGMLSRVEMEKQIAAQLTSIATVLAALNTEMESNKGWIAHVEQRFETHEAREFNR